MDRIKCPRCESDNIQNLGTKYGPQGDKRKVYGCSDCKASNRQWTFPEFYKRRIEIYKCPNCDSKMIRSGINKTGTHKGEQRYICSNDNCRTIGYAPTEIPAPIVQPTEIPEISDKIAERLQNISKMKDETDFNRILHLIKLKRQNGENAEAEKMEDELCKRLERMRDTF